MQSKSKHKTSKISMPFMELDAQSFKVSHLLIVNMILFANLSEKLST